MPLKPETTTELRRIVRDALREVVASRGAPANGVIVETVSISNDQDLASFVKRVTEPATLERLRAGKVRFALEKNSATPPSPLAGEALSGVVTERKIEHLAVSGKLVLAPGAVLTPLARDKARRLGLTIEREQ